MPWWKRHKKKLLGAGITAAVLALAFYLGDGSPNSVGWTSTAPESAQSTQSDAETQAGDQTTASAPASGQTDASSQDQTASSGQTTQTAGTSAQEGKTDPAQQTTTAPAASSSGGDAAWSEAQGMELNPDTGKDAYQTSPVPEGKPVPVEPQNAAVTDQTGTCTLSISCASIQTHLDALDPAKKTLVPADGWLLKPTAVSFYQGESVFHVLLRTCKQQGIPMEYEDTPLYHSAYIEGIGNLYEYDCGSLSGWMYQVNGWFPNYGCSRYALQDGDTVSWQYTCDLGRDIGGDAGDGNGGASSVQP